MDEPEVYPQHVIDGIMESLEQIAQGQAFPFTGIRDMLGIDTEPTKLA